MRACPLAPCLLGVVALASCVERRDADVQMVALSSPIALDAATADVDAFVFDDCDGGTVTVLVGGSVDLLSPQPVPKTLAGGTYCGVGVELTAAPADGALHLTGATGGGTTFQVDLDPGLVVLPIDFSVDGEEWVLVLDADTLIDAAAFESRGPAVTVGPQDADAADLVAKLPDALWFGPEYEARDVYVDLWPFEDVDFHVGVGHVGIHAGSGCNGGVGFPDLDHDGIADGEDPDRDGDGVGNASDPDADGDGTADVDDPDGGGGSSSGGGSGSGGGGTGGGGTGGGSGSGSAGCSCGSGGSGGTGGGGGGGSGSGCSGGGGGGSGCSGGGGGGGGCDSDLSCSTVGFVPPWAVLAMTAIVIRRKRWEKK